jgi:hypothetical protein
MRLPVSSRPTLALMAALATMALAGCAPKGDQVRTVHSYQFATCDSAPTTASTERDALAAFKDAIEIGNFIRNKNTLTVANHEETLDASGLRQYQGPFYWYLHPGGIEPRDASNGVTYSGVAYLHASKVRFRPNGGEWGEWQYVRTRNFGNLNQRSVDRMPRWKCLVGSEIAWASVKLRDGHWDVEPLAISVYEKPELDRLLPVPTTAQIEAKEAIEPLHLNAPTQKSE